MRRLLLCLALLGCSSLPMHYPTWTARVAGDVGATYSGNYTVLQRGGAMASMSVSGTIPAAGAVEWTVSDGGRIIGATFINTGTARELRGEIRLNATVIASGFATGQFGYLVLSPP